MLALDPYPEVLASTLDPFRSYVRLGSFPQNVSYGRFFCVDIFMSA